MALALSTASGVPLMTKFFSCASGGAFLSTSQCAPEVYRGIIIQYNLINSLNSIQEKLPI